MHQTLEDVRIGPGRVRLTLSAIGTAAFTWGGIWMILDGESMGWFISLFFGAAVAVFSWMLIRGRPTLVLSADGIHDQTFRGIIPWRDVEAVGITPWVGSEAVGVRLSDYTALVTSRLAATGEPGRLQRGLDKVFTPADFDARNRTEGLVDWDALPPGGQVIATELAVSRHQYNGYDVCWTKDFLPGKLSRVVATIQRYRWEALFRAG